MKTFMVNYIFNGRILPGTANINIPMMKVIIGNYAINVKNRKDSHIENFEGRVSIISSQVSIIVNTEGKFMYESLTHNLINSVRQTVDAIVDSHNYLTGNSYRFEIISIIDVKNNIVHEIKGIDNIIDLTQEYAIQSDEIMKKAQECIYLRRALADFRDAIRSSTLDTGFYCNRVIESIRHYFGEEKYLDNYNENNHKDESWKLLRDNLNIDKTFLTKNFSNISAQQRHGDIFRLYEEEKIKIILDSWKIIYRFIIYLGNPNNPLSKDKYEEIK